MPPMIPVIVTTEFRGVFFGDIEENDEGDASIRVHSVRNAIYWKGSRGFLGLASHGPAEDSTIGSTAPEVLLHGVTSVSRCTDAAARVWREWPEP